MTRTVCKGRGSPSPRAIDRAIEQIDTDLSKRRASGGASERRVIPSNSWGKTANETVTQTGRLIDASSFGERKVRRSAPATRHGDSRDRHPSGVDSCAGGER
jgi:hypothetical protein